MASTTTRTDNGNGTVTEVKSVTNADNSTAVTTRVLNADGSVRSQVTEYKDATGKVTRRTKDVSTWTTAEIVCVVLGLLVIALLVVVIVLAVELSKQESGTNPTPGVPKPDPTEFSGFTDHTEQGWPCPSMYRVQFVGNSAWSKPSAWTPPPPTGDVTSPPNSHPSIHVANAAGQQINFQRKSKSPGGHETDWILVSMDATDDPTVFIDRGQPCADLPIPPTPVATGDWDVPTGIWPPTSYKIAYSDKPNDWSLWSDPFVCSSEEFPGSNPLIQVGMPKSAVTLIWKRRLSETDPGVIVTQTMVQSSMDPTVYVDTAMPSPLMASRMRRYNYNH